MKIVCQSCSANYKIADEKVQGKKVFKIKCKKCGEDILVRGTDLPAEAAPADAAGGVSSEAVWHAVVNGDQQGPYTAGQVQAMFHEGTVDNETYVWREGFEGWLPIAQVDELAVLLGPPASLSDAFPAASEPAPAGADLFASLVPPTASEPAPAASSGLFGALDGDAATKVSASVTAKTRPVKAAGGDLFAVEVRQQEAAKPLFAEEPAGAKEVPKGEQLTGQRNENSVLFSLATLQQLSGDEKPAAGGAPMAGTASGDSSGLIDINKLSGAIHNERGGKKSSVDDILSVGASSGLGAPLAAPVLAPMALPAVPVAAPVAAPAPEPQRSSPMVWIGVAAILAAGGVAAAFILKSHSEPTPPPQVAAAPTPAAPAAMDPNAVTPPPAAPTAAPTAPAANPAAPAAEPAAPAANPAPAAAAHAPERSRDRDRERPRTTASAPPPPTAAPAAPAARPAPAPARPRAAAGSVSDLMEAVVAGRPAAGAAPAAAAPSSDLPLRPDRTAVIAALRGAGPSVRSCGSGQGGVATVTIVFNSRGEVNTATVAPPVTGAQASCVASAVRRVHVPAFSQPTFSVTYPFALQ
jgi:predicted Zn finger-like uncharacterized protein